MKLIFRALATAVLAAPMLASAHLLHVIPSPTHEQTFAFGSEQHQAWMARGPDHHLALSAEFTNDPYVDRVTPRQYDDFIFDFPDIRLGADGRTFFYHPKHGPAVAIADRRKGFLGIEEVKLFDNVELLIHKPHGYLSLALIVQDRPATSAASL